MYNNCIVRDDMSLREAWEMCQKSLIKALITNGSSERGKSDSLDKASLFPKINYRLKEIEKMKS